MLPFLTQQCVLWNIAPNDDCQKLCPNGGYLSKERERKKNVTPKVDSFLAQDSSWRGPIRYSPPTVSRNSLHSCRKNKFRPWFPITLLLLRINMELEIWIMFKSCKKSLECPHGSKFEKKSRYFRLKLMGSFTNYVDKILVFFDYLPTCIDIYYGMNVDKKWTF